MCNRHLTPIAAGHTLALTTHGWIGRGVGDPHLNNSSGRVVRCHATRAVCVEGAGRPSCGACRFGIATDARQSAPPSAALALACPQNPERPPYRTALRPAPMSRIAAQNELVGKYCATCHSARAKAGGLVLAGFDATKADRERRAHREDDPQAPRADDAARRRRPPGRCDGDGDGRHARRRDGQARRREPASRLATVPAPEPRRVRRRGQGPDRHRRGRQRVAPARHHQRRLRQRRRRPELLARS